MCPAYNIEIFEDVGRAFASSILDIVEDNPISRIPLSKFKSLEAVRNEVAIKNAGGKVTRQALSSNYEKPPLKVKVKKGGLKMNKNNQSKAAIKAPLKKAVSMPAKQPKKTISKAKSDVSAPPLKGGFHKKSMIPTVSKAKSSQSQVEEI